MGDRFWVVGRSAVRSRGVVMVLGVLDFFCVCV